MSFLDDTIITEIHLKDGTIFKSNILKHYPEQKQSERWYVEIEFNLVKFQSVPFPGLLLFLRKFLTEKDKDAEMVDIEEKYVGFIVANEITFLRLMEISDLAEPDQTLLLNED